MVGLNIGQKIIMHLDRFRNTDPTNIYNIPWDLTQDGIATSLRISRAHTSIEVKKLKEAGKVEERQTHIKGGKVKRKSYILTPVGAEEVPHIRKYAEENGIDIDALLDLKKQDPNDIIENLSEEDSYSLGCACVFRIPVPMDILPPHKKAVIPSDVFGMTVINEQLRENMNKVDPAKRDYWHGFAANTWFNDNGKLGDGFERAQEMLYHLTMSGRNIDANKCIRSNTYELTLAPNEDLHESLSKVQPIPKYASEVLPVIITVDLSMDDIEGAEKAVSELAGYDEHLSKLYRSDLEYKNGNTAQAMAILSSLGDDPMATIRIAKINAENGNLTEARNIANSLKGFEDSRIGPERFKLLAQIDIAEGNREDAYTHLIKARGSVPDREKKTIDLIAKEMGFKELDSF